MLILLYLLLSTVFCSIEQQGVKFASFENPRNLGREEVDAPLRPRNHYSTKEALAKRSENMFVFKFMNDSNHFKMIEKPKVIAKMNQSCWIQKKNNHLKAWKNFGKYAIMHYNNPNFKRMFSLLQNIFKYNSSRYEYRCIGQALDFFEGYKNDLIPQVWVLGLVRQFQMYHPTIDILSTGSSGVQGTSLSRIGLALSLTQNMNLKASMINSSFFNSEWWIRNDLKEALKRVELLYRIGKWNEGKELIDRSPILVKVYDDLLKASCPLEDEKVKSLAEGCIEGIWKQEDKTVAEGLWMENILLHLYTFSKSAKKNINESLSVRFGSSEKINQYFEKIKHRDDDY